MVNLRKIYYRLPPWARYVARRLVYLPSDIVSSFSKERKLMPPKGMIFTGGGDFLETGDRFLKYFIDLGMLKPDGKVLDIGSGIGRMAIPMTQYLIDQGEYRGFDMVAKGVNWCTSNITTKYPNFHFKHVNLINDLYSKGSNNAEDYVFPYKDNQFDLSIAISVYTHLIPEETQNYLIQTARVLNKGGRAVFTFFTYEDKPIGLDPKFQFPHLHNGFAYMDDKVLSANVAYQLDLLKDIISKAGLKLVAYHPGSWQSSDPNALDFQDILVLEKLSYNT